jgi:thioredoxin-related protein
MKQTLFVALIFLAACRPQSKETALTNLPSFSMLLMDSTTVLKTQEIPSGKPIVLLFFRPDCPHCRQETQDLVDHIQSFKDVRFYLLAAAPLREIKAFYLKYHLNQFDNFTVGKDQERTFFHAFRPSTVPYLAIYDGNKRLVKIYNGGAGLDYIFKATHL